MKKNTNKTLAVIISIILVLLLTTNIFVVKFLSMNQQLVVVLFSVGLIIMLLFKNSKIMFNIGLVLSLASLLMWNFLFNNLGIFNNNEFIEFQSDSEAFVVNSLLVKELGIKFNTKFGLCYYDTVNKIASEYVSQFGLQGLILSNIFSIANKLFNISAFSMIEIYRTLVSLITAIILSILVIFINKKTNIVMSICFYITFLLSPWIINYARNLYWVEFTWFVPMLIGIICSININNKKARIWCYLLSFLSILIKCLCGYEFVSTIMLSSISFLLVDFIKVIIKKDKENIKLYFKTIFIIGLCEVLGFVVALCIHGLLRGEGSIVLGISTIYKEDILRRTLGGDATNFDPSLAESLNASIWTVLGMYLQFNTNIISFIPKEAFIPMYLIALAISIYEIKNKKYDGILYYIIYFLSAISWIVLAKPHSYEHTHLNYIVWYFGFIQICLYIIVNKIISLIKK